LTFVDFVSYVDFLVVIVDFDFEVFVVEFGFLCDCGFDCG